MEILICENNPELLGGHVLKLKKVFSDSNFCYVQSFSKLMEKVKFYPCYYDFIYYIENQRDKINEQDIYKAIKAQEVSSVVIFVSDKISETKEDSENDFFCLNKSHSVEELNKIFNLVAEQAAA